MAVHAMTQGMFSCSGVSVAMVELHKCAAAAGQRADGADTHGNGAQRTGFAGLCNPVNYHHGEGHLLYLLLLALLVLMPSWE